MKNLTSLCLLVFFLFSCNESAILKTELNEKQLIPAGEWLSKNDSSSGISIREDKLAFFKNMEFGSEDIFKYKIIDSVKINGDVKKIMSSYLITYDSSDTIKYKIGERTNSIIVLKMKNSREEIFTLKKKN